MNSSAPDTAYSGRDNLEAMKAATRYNDFLLGLLQKHSVGTQTLDHGAGAGTFAKPMSCDGSSVLCVEPDADLRSELAGAGLDVASDLADVATASVDYAYSLNVLEHINDDAAAIAELYRCLRPGGHLLVYVPAFPVLFSAMDRHVGHYRRYRRKPLLRLLRNAGFEAVSARYVDSLGFFATLVYKVVGDRSGNVSPSSVAFYDAAIFPLSRFIDRLTAGVIGKNLVVAATKPGHGAPT